MGGLKLNRKLCTSIKTCRGDIKSYTPVPGERMQDGVGGVQSESPACAPSRGAVEEEERDRIAMFNNVHGISAVECTTVCNDTCRDTATVKHRHGRGDKRDKIKNCVTLKTLRL